MNLVSPPDLRELDPALAPAAPIVEPSASGLVPAAPAAALIPATNTSPMFVARTTSPIGRLEITSDGENVTGLSIEKGGHLPLEELAEDRNDVLDTAVAQLDEYFAGKRRDFDVPVLLRGTAFQQSVWKLLSDVPFGEVVSYGAIGLLTGRATAGRAVGGAVGANPVPIIVPCHRILASNKKITGYSAGEGIPTKAWLLAHEGIAHSV